MIHESKITGFNTVETKVDFCVIGGGLAGMFAAISAARHGSRVAIMQDRPVFGGNASSEIRMWIRGANGVRETGLCEELSLRNVYRNPTMNFSVWDSILYEMVKENENITMILNCSCCDAEMDGNRIVSIKGWQTTTQTWQRVWAKIFADCSGDSVLAPITGAEYRFGREAKSEFGESAGKDTADKCTMGMSCLFQIRRSDKKSEFIPPEWAYKYTRENMLCRVNFEGNWEEDNFWWIEIGGMGDTIADTETNRDELLKIYYGVWDYLKNSGDIDADNWELDWAGMLPGKRESRRYVGDIIMTQQDVEGGGRFDDLVAYGGWKMDDHDPRGFSVKSHPGTTYYDAPSPFGIPYRTMYSKNIENLMFAGRNISVSHMAMSACRVMATCGVIGQAVGTAAAIAVKNGLSPRGVYNEKIGELKQTLMEDDCYLPFSSRAKSPIMDRAECDEVLFNGIDRFDENCVEKPLGEVFTVKFKGAETPKWVEIIFDSDLERKTYSGYRSYVRGFFMKHNTFNDEAPLPMPKTLVKAFKITAVTENGEEIVLREEKANRARLVRVPIGQAVKEISIIPVETWGSETARIFSVHMV